MTKDDEDTGLDAEKYREYVDDFDLTEEQKIMLLKSVWDVMQTFVDRAFEDDPVQQLRKTSTISRGIPDDHALDSQGRSMKNDEPKP